MPTFKVAMVANDLPPTPEWVAPQLAEQGISFVERECTTASEVIATAADADVVWLMGGSRVITPDVLPQLPKCRVILRTGTGTDNVPVDEAAALGIVVANTPEVTTHHVAEHALGLLFAVIRQIARQDRLVRQGIWDRYAAWPGWHLHGQTLGLVGFGRIARLLAKKVTGLELRVIACDVAMPAEAMAEQGVEKVSLDELFARSDFISVHVPLLKKTRHLIGEHQLRLMKPTAILVNTARGEVIDQQALVRALSEHLIGGAGIDVVDPEPPAPDDPILRLDNVVLTPHIAGYSDLYRDGFWQHSVDTLIATKRSGQPIWIVTPESGPGQSVS
jgi:D-3-phosphoglycerate dehydrogenase / 2-oxoglutarate reductase